MDERRLRVRTGGDPLKLVYGRDAEVAAYVQRLAPNIDNGFEKFTTIGVERDGKLICGVVFDEYRGHSIHASIAATDARWASRRILAALFSYTFVQLRVKRVTVVTGQSNKHAQQFIERLGFKREGYVREGFKADDMLIYGMLRRECRWIRGEKNVQG